MRRFLVAGILALATYSFADIHPALKNFIDEKNYKQAEKLVKNIGVTDVYCPSSLAVKDADKIYGSIFQDSVGYLLKNCDMDFSISYLNYKCADGKDKNMCLNLVSLTDPNLWPDKYATLFCTKKNVEICAAAVESIPVEKSVPFLKAIKANGLAEMKTYSSKKMRASGNTKQECKSECEALKELGIAEIRRSREIKSHSLRARDESTRYRAEMQIFDLDREEKELYNKNCSQVCSGALDDAKFEKLKIHQYYFENAFLALSERAAQYYVKFDNPIIPGLAENWSVVDNLFLLSNEKSIKAIENMSDTIAMLNAAIEYAKKFERYPNHIAKKYVLDTLKSAFKRNEELDVLERLFYCKLYPSLEKETEEMFGMKILDCKSLLEENSKIGSSCEADSAILDRSIVCENGSYSKRQYWMTPVGEYVVLSENLFEQMPSENVWCPPSGVISCMRRGPLYTWDAAQQVCPEGWEIPNEHSLANILDVMKARNEYSKKDPWYKAAHHVIELPQNGYRDTYKEFHNFDKVSYFLTSEVVNEGKELTYVKVFPDFSRKHINTYKPNTMLSVLCMKKDIENEKCSSYYEEGRCFENIGDGMHCGK